MKKKIMSALILSTVSLSLVACQPLEDVKQGVKEGVEESVKGPKLSKAEYVQSIGDLRKEFEQAFKDWSTVMGNYDSETYQQDNFDEMNKIRGIVDKYKALNAPKEFKEVQDENLKGMKLFEQGLDLMAKALKASNEEEFEQYKQDAMDTLTKGQDHWNYAFALLDVTENIPVGTDGTLFSDDLADLDKNAGIDRSSVITNLSKDGKELVGKWGYYNEDGSFNVSLVIESDGSYSGYAKGTYPETDMKGTWEYDYLKRVVTFEHDKSEYRELRMDVQSFQKENVQLMDLDSLTTFNYVKEGTKQKPKKEDDSSVQTSTSTPSSSSETTSSKPSTPSKSSSTFATEDELSDTSWFWDTDGWDSKMLGLNQDGTGLYSLDIGDTHESYRGIWNLEGDTIVLDVKEATADFGKKEITNAPDELHFEIVTYDGKSMELKFNGKIEKYDIYE